MLLLSDFQKLQKLVLLPDQLMSTKKLLVMLSIEQVVKHSLIEIKVLQVIATVRADILRQFVRQQQFCSCNVFKLLLLRFGGFEVNLEAILALVAQAESTNVFEKRCIK